MASSRQEEQIGKLAIQIGTIQQTIAAEFTAIKERLAIAKKSFETNVAGKSGMLAAQTEGMQLILNVNIPLIQMMELNNSMKLIASQTIEGADIAAQLDEIVVQFQNIRDGLANAMAQINSKVYFGSLSSEDIATISAKVQASSAAASQSFVDTALSMITKVPTSGSSAV